MPYQLPVTVQASVSPERLDDLRDLLTEMNKNGPANPVLPFDRLPGVHFARLVILPQATDLAGEVIPPSFVYLSEVDAPPDRHLDDLVAVAGAGLDQLFGHCPDYPGALGRDADRVRWLRAHRVPAAAYYVNTLGRGAQQIRRKRPRCGRGD